MSTIVISEFMEQDAVAEILVGYDVHFDASLCDKPAELAAALKDARALIVRNRTQVRADLVAAAPLLECVGRLGVGLDNIDMAACKARGIAVYPAIGANEVSVAEYVIGAIIVLMRGVFHATSEVMGGKWPRTTLVGREISGKRLGLVGFGANARETALRALALGMKVEAFDPHVPADHPAWRQGPVSRSGLDELLAQSDVVSLHAPLTPETCNLLDHAALSRVQPGAILINAARGGIVDENAVAGALKAGRLGGAALDVFGEEPLSAARAAVFAGCPNLILTPHVAGITAESNRRISRVTAENVRRHLGG